MSRPRRDLDGPPDPFAAVDLEPEPFGREGRMPDHVGAGPAPTGRCVHGVGGAQSCARCEAAAMEKMRETYARPGFTPSAARKPWGTSNSATRAASVLRLLPGDDQAELPRR